MMWRWKSDLILYCLENLVNEEDFIELEVGDINCVRKQIVELLLDIQVREIRLLWTGLLSDYMD